MCAGTDTTPEHSRDRAPALCARFPDEYRRGLGEGREFPRQFCEQALGPRRSY